MLLPDHLLLHVLSLSNDATAIYGNIDLEISFVNTAMLGLWGKQGDVIGKTLGDAVPELRDQPFLDLLRNVWETGETYTALDTPAMLKVDGQLSTYYFDFEYRPILDGQKNTFAILHTAKDVTERREAWLRIAEKQKREEELIAELTASNESFKTANQQLKNSNDNIKSLNERLQESETDFRRLVEQAPVAILLLRGENLVIDIANQVMLEILDKDSDIIGKPILEAMPELTGQPAVDLLFDVYRSGRIEEGLEVPVKMKRHGETETRFFNFNYRPLMDNGKIVGVMDVAVEVTAQVFAKQTLRANEQRLQGMLDTMAEGVVIVDAGGKPTYANPMAQKIMEMDEFEIFSQFYGDGNWRNQHLDGSTLLKENHPIEQVLSSGQAVYDQEIALLLPTGDKKFISINAAPLNDEYGRTDGGIATFTDVTQRRIAMQQKDDFISVASHELKTPITSLKASIQLLDRLKYQMDPTMMVKLIDQSNKSLNKLSELVASLLNTNRISLGQFPLNKTKFMLEQMMKSCIQQLQSTTNQKIELAGKLDLIVEADEQLIEQVLVNFLNNALKYASKGEEILVDISQVDGFAKVSVRDFGPGIEAGKIDHVFERYYRANHGESQFSGLGLGLYISAEIINKHGGKIGVVSKVGRGSTFWFTIPLIN